MTGTMRAARRRGPDPLVAVALSAVWPGLGHFRHSNRRAMVLAGSTLSVTAVGAFYIATRGIPTLLAWSVNPVALRLLVWVGVFSLVIRGAVAVDAYRTAARRQPYGHRSAAARLASAVSVLALAVIIAAPHVLAIGFATVQMTLLVQVFDTAGAQTAIPSPLPAGAAPANVTEATVEVTVTTSVARPAPESSGTAPVQLSAWDGSERLTIALLGSDAGFDRRGVRTDTIIVVSIDVATGDAAAFSVPRNWRHVTFPEGTPAAERWPEGYPDILNEIYGLGLRFPEAFPGVEDTAGHAIKSALAQLTGLHIQYYVSVDMIGFVKAIDLFGGIDIYVSESINDRIKPVTAGGPHIDIVVEPGEHHFDGLTALGYVRSRTQSTDWHRMTRQRCVIEALIDQVPPLEVVYRYGAFGDIIANHVDTDIPLDRLGELVMVANKLDTSRIVTVNFIPPEFQPGDAPVTQVREAVEQAIRDRTDPANRVLEDSCNRSA